MVGSASCPPQWLLAAVQKCKSQEELQQTAKVNTSRLSCGLGHQMRFESRVKPNKAQKNALSVILEIYI